MEYLAELLTKFILRKDVIDESEYEIYRYGFLTGMEMLVCCMTSLVIAIYLNALMKLIVFIFVFFPLRAYCGGIHAKHFYMCFICSNLVIVAALLIPSELFAGNGMLLVECFLLLLTDCMAYKAIIYEDDAEKKYFCKMRKITMVIIALFSIALVALHRMDLSMVVIYTVFVTFLSEGIQLIKIYGIKVKKTK